MFDLALHHLTDGERERATATDLRRRRILKMADAIVTSESRPAIKPTIARLGNPRPAGR